MFCLLLLNIGNRISHTAITHSCKNWTCSICTAKIYIHRVPQGKEMDQLVKKLISPRHQQCRGSLSLRGKLCAYIMLGISGTYDSITTNEIVIFFYCSLNNNINWELYETFVWSTSDKTTLLINWMRSRTIVLCS